MVVRRDDAIHDLVDTTLASVVAGKYAPAIHEVTRALQLKEEFGEIEDIERLPLPGPEDEDSEQAKTA